MKEVKQKSDPPVCPSCGDPLNRVRIVAENVLDFNPDKGWWDGNKDKTSGEFRCLNCDANITDEVLDLLLDNVRLCEEETREDDDKIADLPEVMTLDTDQEIDIFVPFDDLEKAKQFKKLLEESLDGQPLKAEIYMQVDGDETDDRYYVKGIHVINRTGVYAVVAVYD